MKELNLKKSMELYEEAKELIPGGVLGIRRPINFVPGEYPVFIKKGKGGRITDVDGNEYIDFLCSYGPIILGHCEKEVDDAAKEQIDDGFCFNLVQPWQNQLAKKLREHIPCAEQSIFLKTGSDATSAAIRIARAFTDRTKVVRCGYHGWHDWCVEVKGGVSPHSYQDTLEFHYNDFDALQKLFSDNKGQIAAVIMTPVGHDLNHPMQAPKNKFLENVRELTKKEKAVLIFDEIRTGFRFSMGGAQKYYKVTPDLATFGKAMANGYPIAAVCGKREIMSVITDGKAFISSTFFSNSMEMRAALKTIEIMEREKALDAIWKKGEALMKGVVAAIEDTGVRAHLSGFAPMSFITFPKDEKKPDDKTYKERRKMFYTQTIRRGLFMQPFHHGYVAYRHSDEDIKQAVNIVRDSFAAVVKNHP